MGIAYFQQGTEIKLDGVLLLLKRKVGDGIWQLEERKTLRIRERTDTELRALYRAERLEFIDEKQASTPGASQPTRTLSPFLSGKRLEDAKVRRVYAKAAIGLPCTQSVMEACSQEVWEKLRKPLEPPHWLSVYRWRKELVESGQDIAGVADKHSRRGNRKRRYPNEVIELVDQAVQTTYMTSERKTVQDALDAALHATRRENKLRPSADPLPLPTRRLIQAQINAIPHFDRCVARFGRLEAVRRFRAVLSHRITSAPLERVEIDHTVLDLMVIDEETGLPLGRPTLTACIDDFTRCVLGISISFEPPSFLALARCLKHAILPKVGLRDKYPEIVNEWEPHGVPAALVMDQALESHANSLEAACLSLGMEMHYAPRKTPWFKGKIERFLGTMNRGVAHVAPGTTFSNIFEKGDYDPAKEAVITTKTLNLIAHKWVVDVYHEKPHRTLEATPIESWRAGIRAEDIGLPDDPTRLSAVLGRREERVLTHRGIELEGLLYNSSELQQLRHELGERLTVEVCVDDGDIGSIAVIAPGQGRVITAPALRQDYARHLTRWQHKVCKRFATERLKKHDPSGWLEAKAAIAELIRAQFALKRSHGARKISPRSQKKMARYLNVGGEPDAMQAIRNPDPPESPERPPVDDRNIVEVTQPSANSVMTPPVAAGRPLAGESVRALIAFKPERRDR